MEGKPREGITCDICITGAHPTGHRLMGFVPSRKNTKLDLTTDAVANLVNLDMRKCATVQFIITRVCCTCVTTFSY